MRKLIPIKDYILLQKPKTDSKLVVPDTVAGLMKDEFFVVTAVGKECKEIKIGDGVITITQQLSKMEFEGKEVIITREENVGVIVREQK